MNRSPKSPVSCTPASADDAVRASDATSRFDEAALRALALDIKTWGRELGFGAIGISDTDLSAAEAPLAAWLEAGCHGEMDYMAKHGMKRARPAELVAGTRRVITVRIAYLPARTLEAEAVESMPQDVSPPPSRATPRARDWRAAEHARLADPSTAVVSIYARGRDYHKVMRQRLQQLADRIEAATGPFGYRVFTDSAPVLEVELAQKAGIGWRGKHTLLLQRDAGSLFFIGEIYVDIPAADRRRNLARGRARNAGLALRQLRALHRRLSDRRDRRAVQGRRAALHLVSDDRAEGQYSARAAAADRQSGVRL
ncbi:hypothetical protein QFZ96_003006 [Paraburkholderia youngii]